MLTLKTCTTLKFRVMFNLVGTFGTSSSGGSISSNSERTAPRKGGEEPGYTEVLQQRASSLNIKRLFLIRGSQVFQAKEFSTFYVWEDTRVWTH